MAEPVTVVWWTADAPLFESTVHPGPDEGFVAVYPLRPTSDQRATLVAVVDRAVLPTARGMTIGNQDGTTIEMAPLGEPEVLDVSTAADPRTRTPPWDLMPATVGWSRRRARRSAVSSIVGAVEDSSPSGHWPWWRAWLRSTSVCSSARGATHGKPWRRSPSCSDLVSS